MNDLFIKGRKGLWISRNAFINCWGYYNSLSNILKIISAYKKHTHRIRRKVKRGFRYRPIGEKGAINSIEFLIYLTIILFLLFGGVDYYVTQLQLSGLEHIKDYYMDRIRIEGHLTQEARTELVTSLDNRGYKDITINVKDNVGNDITESITRNTEDAVSSIIELEIKASPKFTPFMFGRLIGVKEDENFYFLVKGKVLSEKPM